MLDKLEVWGFATEKQAQAACEATLLKMGSISLGNWRLEASGTPDSWEILRVKGTHWLARARRERWQVFESFALVAEGATTDAKSAAEVALRGFLAARIEKEARTPKC